MIERFGFLISCLLVRCGDLASPYLDGRSANSSIAPAACCSLWSIRKVLPQFSPRSSLQLRVLRLRSDEDGDVRVGVFPECEEILICPLGFGGVALHRVGRIVPAELQTNKLFAINSR
jgi:hypothetical protein